MKIVITGGCGYIGSLLTQRIADYYSEVKVFDNLMYNQGPLVKDAMRHAEVFVEDVNDWSDNLKRAIDEADIIYPLAALVGAPLCDQRPDEAEETNARWFDKLLPLLSRKQRVIYPNTNSGYGTTAAGEVCTEDTPLNPISLYGTTKKHAEDVLTANYNNYVVFRLATLFGLSPRPRMDLLVNNLTIEACKTGMLDIFDGHFRRNYVHVDDVVRVFYTAGFSYDPKIKNKVYNLGNDRANCTKLQLAKKIANHTGAKVVENGSRTDPDKRDYEVSSQKMRDELLHGWEKMKSLDRGIKAVAQFAPFYTDLSSPIYRNY